MWCFFIALRAKGWEPTKDIGSPAYQCARFAARLTFGLDRRLILGGPKEERRRLLMNAVTSIAIYAAPLWAGAMNKRTYRTGIVCMVYYFLYVRKWPLIF